MTGHSKDNFKGFLWADAEFDTISIDYDEIIITITETASSRSRKIHCRGYIGYKLEGFWDEVVIEKGDLVSEDGFLTDCINNLEKRYPSSLPETGQTERNRQEWRVLIVKFSDGAEMKIVANKFYVE